MMKAKLCIIFLFFQYVGISQEIKVIHEPEFLFSLNADYVNIHSSGDGGYIGAMAMEYHEGYLYFATLDQIIKTDLNGNVQQILEHKPITTDPRQRPPLQMELIYDIVFVGDTLYAYERGRILWVIVGMEVKAKYLLDFYKSSLEEMMQSPGFYFQPRFLINVDGKLYFNDNEKSLALLDLVDERPLAKGLLRQYDAVYINKHRKTPIKGLPISECEYLEWVLSEKSSWKNLDLEITNICTGNSEIISRKFSDLVDFEYDDFSVADFFKNNYLNDYFVRGYFVNFANDMRILSIINLDSYLNISNITTNLKFYPGETSHNFRRHFTYDEKGNIYYFANKYDYEKKEDSVVDIFKIRGEE